jgi:chorismate synthase
MIARREARAIDTVEGASVVATPPIGLGSYVHWDRRLDAALARRCDINIVKGVELGGVQQTRRFGSESTTCRGPGATGHGSTARTPGA